MPYDESAGHWRSALASLDLEVNLAGPREAALPINIEMARYVETHFTSVLSDAVAFIAEKVVAQHAIQGDPDPQWLDCGLTNYGEHDEFELYFSDADTCTLWSVRFRFARDFAAGGFHAFPLGFSRRSW